MSELKPALIVIAGPLGAGKTTFYEAHLKEAFPELIPPIAHKRDEMVRARRSFAVEDWTVDLELLENARQAGYTTKVLFISTEDPNLNVGRVLLRMSQSGQGVPLGTIPESYDLKRVGMPTSFLSMTTHRMVKDIGWWHVSSPAKCSRQRKLRPTG